MSTVGSSISPNVAFFPANGDRKGVSFVIHGLNTKALAMHDIVALLNARGIDAYVLTLAGHHEQLPSIREVTSDVWDADTRNGYAIARHASKEANVPLYFVGHSFGALVAQRLLTIDRQTTFEKQVLLAPATCLRTRTRLIRALFLLGEKVTLPSYTPERYRANRRLPLKVYKILFGMVEELYRSDLTRLNIPTLILIDPQDELVSSRKLRRLREKLGLNNQEIVEIKIEGTSFHHMIFTPSNTGVATWNSMTEKICAFLQI